MLVRVIEGFNMEIIYKSTKDIKEYENNPRKNEEAVEYVANSIKEFGFKLDKMYKKVKVLINGKSNELFYAYLYRKGIREVYMYEVNSTFKKQYGFFTYNC